MQREHFIVKDIQSADPVCDWGPFETREDAESFIAEFPNPSAYAVVKQVVRYVAADGKSGAGED